jgi:hypothetical protein
MEKVQGTVKIVAKTLGVKLEQHDGWFNPTEVAKEYIRKLKIGDVVEFTLDDSDKVSFVKVLGKGDEIKQVAGSTEKLDKDRLIIRQNVLARAVEIYLADKCEKEEVLKIAASFEKWVLGEI